MDELTPWWTVVGVLPNNNDPARSKRWMGNFQTISARTAEDIARMEVQEEWDRLGLRGKALFWVCGVFEGKHASADAAYATFVDPDEIDN